MLGELVRRGHRVTCLVAERFADLVRTAGAEAVVYESSFPWYTGPTDSALRTMLDFFEESLAPLTAAACFDDDRPDIVLHDLAASETARMLARKWGVPVVQLCPTIASSPTFSMSARQSEEASEAPAEPITPDDPAIVEFVARRDAALAAAGLTNEPV